MVLRLLLTVTLVSFALAPAVALRGGTSNCLPCRLARPHVLWDEDEATTPQKLHSIKESFHCLTEGPGYQGSYALPEWFVRAHSDSIHEPMHEVCLPRATINVTGPYGEGEVVMDQSDIDIADILVNDDRKLFARDATVRYGTQRLLAVHISTQTEQPDVTVDAMQMALFGTGSGTMRPGTVSVLDQYQYITKGQLLYTAASGPNIIDGMLEVKIPLMEIAGEDVFRVIPVALSKTVEALNGTSLKEVADRVLFCLPSSTLKSGAPWRAFTYLFGPYSYYQAATCSLLEVLAHELGHGLGFQHSGQGENVYGDLTGYMGGWPGPRMAFNGHKHWMSGWFGPAAVEVEPQLQQHIVRRLLNFVDYNISDYRCLAENDAVLVKAGNLYLQYNHARGYNVDVSSPNTVTITEAASDNVVSNALEALSSGEAFTYKNYDKDGNSLIVEVCDMFRHHAVINLYLSKDGPQQACVSGAPSASPSHFPTFAPSSSPTSLALNATRILPPSLSPGPCGASLTASKTEKKEGTLPRLKVLMQKRPWLMTVLMGLVLIALVAIVLRHCFCCVP